MLDRSKWVKMSDLSRRLKVVLAEDDDDMRSLLVRQLERDSRISVSASVKNGFELVNYLKNADVDLVLIDVEMPVMDGIEAAQSIKLMKPDLPLVMLTAFERKSRLMDALAAGVSGFLTKDMPTRELVDSLVLVVSGHTALSDAALNFTTDVFRNLYRRSVTSAEWEMRVNRLSEKHMPVYALLILGLGNRQIAQKTLLSEGTVRTYVSEILEILECQSRAEVIRHASLAETVDILRSSSRS